MDLRAFNLACLARIIPARKEPGQLLLQNKQSPERSIAARLDGISLE
jgi:hypothetical protein